ncbi:hypothetical protein [Caballeronia sp. AZ7_KS35]|uniref:hypothetical protein n=1 Tax=Caballeronia sp. AZ7_KS35 TaxID=2921762 RepID=UPI002028BCA4|nr:hypothetical protein [Caballeronia sp. AZ7_KS35]
MSKRTPIQRLRAAATKFEEEPDAVCGYWRGYLVWVERDDADCLWYIRVIHPDGGYLYDGYWRDSHGRDGADAVAEAFAGAELLEGDQ